MISHMEKIMPSFEYEPLVLSLELNTLNEEEDKRDIDGAWPLGTRIIEEPRNLRGGKKSHEKEASE